MTEKTKTANPLDRASDVFAGILDNLNIVLKGKNEQAELAVTCLMAEGHLLIEDKPGTGKTSLARSRQPSTKRRRRGRE